MDVVEDPPEEGQQPHKDLLAGTPMGPASNAANKDTSLETAP